MMNGSPKLYEKNTSFTKRPGVPQVASYFVFLLETVLFYSVVLPKLSGPAQATFGVLYSISLLLLVGCTVICGKCDPSDRVMIQYRNGSREEYACGFQQFRKTCTVKLLFCDYCHSFVRERSRHCRACDRCVEDFDHHCMWINNCVGGMNYRIFLGMIIAAFTNLLLYVLALLVLTLQNEPSTFLEGFIAAWISGGINAVFVLLLANLIALHIYLIHKGISTYEFIMAQREEERKQKEKEQQEKREASKPDSQKIVMKAIEPHSNGSSREQEANIEMKQYQDSSSDNAIRASGNVIHVRSQKHQSSPKSRHSHKEEREDRQQVPSIVFGHNDLTEKSENMNGPQREGHGIQQGESSGESSLELSQLFTRNKSLKFIIGKNEFYRPHHTSREPTRDSKSKSMFARP